MSVYKFNDYITSDIQDKKVVLDLLPKNTQNRQIKYNETVDEIKKEYLMYQSSMSKFILYKFEKLMPKETFINTSNEESRIEFLDKIITLGNPITSFFEKLELDTVLYDLVHYYNFSITDINKNIKKIISKFKEAGIDITEEDFKMNTYEYIYMSYIFKEMKNGNEEKQVGNHYEKIYWKCSKVFEYLILNIRFLIDKNKKKFIKYADIKYRSMLKESHLNSYNEVFFEIRRNYKQMNEMKKISEYEFINGIIDGKIDANYYSKDNEERLRDISGFMIRKVGPDSPLEYNKMLDKIRSLRYNLEEYSNYLEDAELLNFFFKKYKDFAVPKVQENDKKKGKTKDKKKKEKFELPKIDYNILWKLKGNKFYDTLEDLEMHLTTADKDLYFKQNNELDKVYKQMNESDAEYFNHNVITNIKENTTIAELFNIICSYRYFTRRTIKDVFDITSIEKEQEANQKIDHIKKMLYNPERKIIDSIPVFVNANIPQILMNSYRFENIDLFESSFELGTLMSLMQKIDKILLYYEVQNFTTTIDEIKFIRRVTTLKNSNKL